MKASFKKHILKFIIPGGTSRGVLKNKTSYYIILNDQKSNVGFGEVSIIKNLSIDDNETLLENKLSQLMGMIMQNNEVPKSFFNGFPSLLFAYETAILSLKSKNSFNLFPSIFSAGEKGQRINGLIWMGDSDFMISQIKIKLDAGFSCLKLKIGALNFQEELKILKSIRQSFSPEVLEIRVDANGAFNSNEALEKLNLLSKFNVHSIEQPIRQGQWLEMADLCKVTPIPIALDEELIGISKNRQTELLEMIKPQYIILKPSLLGGFEMCDNWIEKANKQKVDWWLTSALEGNIGLNAIAQYAFTKNNLLPQGLGTGQLYSNNISSPLTIIGEEIWYLPNSKWDLSFFDDV